MATLRSEDMQATQPRNLAEILVRIPGVRVIEQALMKPASPLVDFSYDFQDLVLKPVR